MNGVLTTEQRLLRKRALEAELAVVRSQKAEVLRAIGQISKKQKLGGPPLPAAQATPGSKAEIEERVHRDELAKVWSTCSKILQAVLKGKDIKVFFGEPVHADLFPTYYTVIKEPRDLGTIKHNVDSGRYPDVYALRQDVRLCFENCRTFNPSPADPVRKLGDGASEKFEQRWVQQNVEALWEAEQRRHALAMQRIDAETQSLPEKIREVDAELQELVDKARAREVALPPGPGREMTFEEKRKLSYAVGTLPGERLARVLEIIAEGPAAAPLGDEGDEVELDIDDLDADTMWKVQFYVEAALADIASKAPPTAAAAAAAGAAPAAAAGAGGKGTTTGADGSESEEGVGSKGNDSNMGDTAADAKKAAGAADMTTFVSATGPQGQQPQILRNAAQKKDVQLADVGAWATLTQEPGGGGDAAEGADGGGGGEEDAGADDDLWNEFQGRATQEREAEEKKAALEEEQRRAREEEAAAAAEAERAKLAEEEAAAKRAEEEAAERRQREEEELRHLGARGAEDADAEMLRRAGHESGADLAELGLTVRRDEDEAEDEPMEEI